MKVNQQMFSEQLHDCLEYIQDWDHKALDDFKMMSLEQWDAADVSALQEEGRPALVFDRLRPLIQAVAGSQSTNRYTSTFVPREYRLEDIDMYASKGAREWARWVQQVGDWEHEESIAFMDALTCGVGCLEMYMSYEDDPDGRIMLRRRPIWEMLWDPSSVQPNMRDNSMVIADKWLHEDEIAAIFGQDAVDDVIEEAESQTTSPRREGFWSGMFTTKTTEQRHAYDLTRPRNTDDRFYDQRRNRIRLFEYQRIQREYRVRVIGPDLRDMEKAVQTITQGGQPDRLDSFEPKDKADELIRELQDKAFAINSELDPEGMNPPVKMPVAIDDFPVKYYYRSWHTKTSALKEEVMPFQGFTHLFLTCHEDWSQENARHWFGLVRQGKDPQKYSNKFLSQAIHLFSANPKGALIYEEGLFRDKERAAEEWNKATGLIPVEDGKLQMPNEPFRQLTSNVNMRGIEGLLGFSQQATPASMGLSEAYTVGSVSDLRRTSGEAVNSVMEQNIKTQAAPFDSLRLYRKMAGRLLLGFTDAYSDPEQIIRVVGEDDVAFVQALMQGGLQEEYDVVAEEAPTSANERQEMFKVMYESGVLPQLVSQGVPIPPELAEMFPGDPEAIEQLKIAFQKAYDVQVMQLEIQKMEMEMQVQQMQMGIPPEQQGQPGGGEAPPSAGGGIQ